MNKGRLMACIEVAEGNGGRVAFISCEVCGAAIMIDPMDSDDALERHTEWHTRLDARLRDGEYAAAMTRPIG